MKMAAGTGWSTGLDDETIYSGVVTRGGKDSGGAALQVK
jgi:hypothetical protein